MTRNEQLYKRLADLRELLDQATAPLSGQVAALAVRFGMPKEAEGKLRREARDAIAAILAQLDRPN
jgi:hypothetical protein